MVKDPYIGMPIIIGTETESRGERSFSGGNANSNTGGSSIINISAESNDGAYISERSDISSADVSGYPDSSTDDPGRSRNRTSISDNSQGGANISSNSRGGTNRAENSPRRHDGLLDNFMAGLVQECDESSPDNAYLGSLPPAMCYVPMQRWNTTYPLGKGLSRGTIFPELDLPFSGGTER